MTAAHQPVYNAERARLLRRICMGLARSVENGASLNCAIKRAVKRWKGKPFRSCPGKALHVSPTSLYDLYRAWNRSHNADVFSLRYKGPNADRSHAQAYFQICVTKGESFADALLILLKEAGFSRSSHTAYRLLTHGQKARVKLLFSARQNLARMERSLASLSANAPRSTYRARSESPSQRRAE